MIRMLPSFNRLIFNYNQFKYCSESIIKVNQLMILSNQEYLNDDKVDFDQNIELKNIDFNYSKKKICL